MGNQTSSEGETTAAASPQPALASTQSSSSLSSSIPGYTHTDHTEIADKLPYASFARLVNGLHLVDLRDHRDVLDALTAKFKENWSRGLGSESFIEDTFCRTMLRGAIFVGHVNTDLDSVASAICAAELYKGIPSRSEESYNGEIEWALKYVGMEVPPVFDTVPGATAPDAKGRLRDVVLVDHNEVDQMTLALRKDPQRFNRIVGLIDHHAIASSFMLPNPPKLMDVRAWGCACTIIFHQYLRSRVPIRKEIARLLLCTILSDTLNLKSGTTTTADRFAVALLASLGEVDDVIDVAMKLFQAKTKWIVGLGAYEMVRGDQKNFVTGVVRWSVAVLEVTTVEPVLNVAEDILTQLRVFKYETGDYRDPVTDEKKHDCSKECHCALLFVVDTLEQRSVALVCGKREKFALGKAFPEATFRAANPSVRAPSTHVAPEETLCDVGGLVSRKLQFKPRIEAALEAGVPDDFTHTSNEMKRLHQVIESPKTKPIGHDSVQVTWDRARLNAAVFYSGPDLETLQDIPETVESERSNTQVAPAA